MKLRVFDKRDYDLLIGWIDSEKLNYQWSGPNFHFPLDSVQIHEHCSKAEVFPFIFSVSGQNAGYIELVKVSESHFRVCRVFISAIFRGQSISKLMLGQLIELARTKYNASLLSLAVFEQNKVAKSCYESLGFKVTSYEKGTRSFEGETWDLLLMEKRL